MKVINMVPAAPGWIARPHSMYGVEPYPVAVWAIVEDANGTQHLVGLEPGAILSTDKAEELSNTEWTFEVKEEQQ